MSWSGPGLELGDQHFYLLSNDCEPWSDWSPVTHIQGPGWSVILTDLKLSSDWLKLGIAPPDIRAGSYKALLGARTPGTHSEPRRQVLCEWAGASAARVLNCQTSTSMSHTSNLSIFWPHLNKSNSDSHSGWTSQSFLRDQSNVSVMQHALPSTQKPCKKLLFWPPKLISSEIPNYSKYDILWSCN